MSAGTLTETLRVVVSTGQVHYIETYPGETLADIRRLLSDRYGYPHTDMTFTLRGKAAADDLCCDEIENTNDDYLKCSFPATKKTFLHDLRKEHKCPSHIAAPNRWICGSEVVRPKPERQKQESLMIPPAPERAPPKAVVVRRTKQVHRIIAPAMGPKKTQSTGASSIYMLLSNGEQRASNCL